jgi:galactose mutarotase-like enzyme
METLTLTLGDTVVELVPARGAIVTRVRTGGTEILYLDRDTLRDPSKNVRGGIPVLFPFAGKLENDRLTAVRPATIKQHGFGRNVAWRVAAKSEHEAMLEIEATDATRTAYPFAFRFRHRVTALADGVELALTADNLDEVPLPMAPGWHPYFNCAPADKARVTGDLAGFDPSRLTDEREFDFGLARSSDEPARFRIPGTGEITIAPDRSLRHVQLWSLPGKPFVCIEPFLGPAGTINGPARDEVPPGGSHTYTFSIRHRP